MWSHNSEKAKNISLPRCQVGVAFNHCLVSIYTIYMPLFWILQISEMLKVPKLFEIIITPKRVAKDTISEIVWKGYGCMTGIMTGLA